MQGERRGGERDKRSCKQIVTTHRSRGISLVITQGVAEMGAHPLSLFVFFGVLPITVCGGYRGVTVIMMDVL